VPEGEYDPTEGRGLVSSYLTRIEQELATIFGRQSIAYWLHLYRRISPGPSGINKDAKTVALVRATFEAAVQKYALFSSCNRVARSDEVPPEKILRGMLMGPEFQVFREAVRANPQLVLTDFGVEEMQELYDTEKLCHEAWRSTAALRILGKGASLIVERTSPYFYDNRSDELHHLVRVYDNRNQPGCVTATGTVYEQPGAEVNKEGWVLIPTYNVHRVPGREFNKFFHRLGMHLVSPPHGTFVSNFLWGPFDLRSYYAAHKPFGSAFADHHGVSLESVLIVVASLLLRALHAWTEKKGRVVHYWQRAYDGPYTRSFIEQDLKAFLKWGIRSLGLNMKVSEIDVSGALRFLELTGEKRALIDLAVPGPHSILLPLNEDRVFIDYAWCGPTLYNLFYGVKLEDQNFKGAALEKVVRARKCVLPEGPCKALNGESRQIDASFAVGDTLAVVECRAIGRSFGVDRGDPVALNFRRQKIDQLLAEADSKAAWLGRNPAGINYDVRSFKRILPVTVSPFVEYLPSTSHFYWLSPEVPRVLTPSELRELLSGGALDAIASSSPNAVAIVGGSHMGL
jgi:hypothetical protein